MTRAVGVGGVLALVMLAAGCGTGGIVRTGDAGQGKTIFTQKCGSCHTLADAGSTGTIGPNLDDAFRYDRKQGFEQSTIKQVVKEQIKIAEPPMPNEDQLFPKCKKGQSSSGGSSSGGQCSDDPGADVADVAEYVSQKAGIAEPKTTTAPSPAAPAQGGGGAQAAGTGQGKQVFENAGCGSCHTLKDAGTTGKVGPDLDALKPPEPIVERQVTNGGGGMPPFKGQLSKAQIKAVAQYVSSVAGK